jgi:Spy/CpxP family protein refolding chaperone
MGKGFKVAVGSKRTSVFCFFLLLLFLYPVPGLLIAESQQGVIESWEEKITLTSEQARAIQDLRSQFLQELISFRKQITDKRIELKTLTPEEFRGERGNQLRREMQTLLHQGRERSLFYQQQALSILTPAQQAKLPPGTDLDFRCSWGMGHRGGLRMGPHRGGPPNPRPPE